MMAMTIDILYFAWLRDRIGQPRETLTTSAATVRDLIAELVARDEGHAAAFADLAVVRCAVDQQLADLDAPLADAREVAFFPPMTGG
ncbi:molybdopterin synthase subunit MoaD [Paracoccus alcaliphilus]|uniref:Molybdopterin synthase sulfur carrier subunit n=1 Tax=Paracoccus alcaliphilus TaxID=34002 RepID=A0A1H8LL40_9RHOB|nr:molybdopterin synthase subunit MoaD [Paracoccus alcaliphilus]